MITWLNKKCCSRRNYRCTKDQRWYAIKDEESLEADSFDDSVVDLKSSVGGGSFRATRSQLAGRATPLPLTSASPRTTRTAAGASKTKTSDSVPAGMPPPPAGTALRKRGVATAALEPEETHDSFEEDDLGGTSLSQSSTLSQSRSKYSVVADPIKQNRKSKSKRARQ